MLNLVLNLSVCLRHGVPGGSDGGVGSCLVGSRRRSRGHHHLLLALVVKTLKTIELFATQTNEGVASGWDMDKDAESTGDTHLLEDHGDRRDHRGLDAVSPAGLIHTYTGR